MSERDAERIRAWVEAAVIGLDLCPFASAVFRREGVRIHLAAGSLSGEEAVDVALQEVTRLLDGVEPSVETTLVVYQHALAEFEDFLAVLWAVEDALQVAGAEGLLQVASFHPDYRFDGLDPDDHANWTNRSPLPVLHLLREEDGMGPGVRAPDYVDGGAREVEADLEAIQEAATPSHGEEAGPEEEEQQQEGGIVFHRGARPSTTAELTGAEPSSGKRSAQPSNIRTIKARQCIMFWRWQKSPNEATAER